MLSLSSQGFDVVGSGITCCSSPDLGDSAPRRAARRITQCRSLLFVFAAPEAVLTVLACPASTGKECVAIFAIGTCECLALGSPSTALAGWSKEEIRLPYAQPLRSPFLRLRHYE